MEDVVHLYAGAEVGVNKRLHYLPQCIQQDEASCVGGPLWNHDQDLPSQLLGVIPCAPHVLY